MQRLTRGGGASGGVDSLSQLIIFAQPLPCLLWPWMPPRRTTSTQPADDICTLGRPVPDPTSAGCPCTQCRAERICGQRHRLQHRSCIEKRDPLSAVTSIDVVAAVHTTPFDCCRKGRDRYQGHRASAQPGKVARSHEQVSAARVSGTVFDFEKVSRSYVDIGATQPKP